MDLKVDDRVFHISHQCPEVAPKKATLKRNLREHGPEAFLVSHKLRPFAGCVVEELRKAGAEEVDSEAGS